MTLRNATLNVPILVEMCTWKVVGETRTTLTNHTIFNLLNFSEQKIV